MFEYTKIHSNIYKFGNKIFNLNNISFMEFKENEYDPSKSYVNVMGRGISTSINMTKSEFEELQSLIFNEEKST